MDDVQRVLAAAWKTIRPRLARDAAELRRRLARRHGALLQSPPRAWCLAVRASDTRITDETRVPLTAAELPPSFVQHSSFIVQHSSAHSPHQLTLDADDVRALCAPVWLDAPGEPLRVVAEKLGCSPSALLTSRLNGRFHTHHVQALDGHWGKPHPMLYCRDALDPAARGFAVADALWSITAPHLAARIPRKLRATLTRIPVFHDVTRDFRDKSDLHPEHPDVDRTFDTRPRTRSRKLPPPEPDFVSYKWKGDQYIGYAWRDAETNPLIRENYERRQRRLEMQRAAAKRRRQTKPTSSAAGGSLKFRGWRWLCPHCGRAVNVLFHPLPRLHLLPGKLPKLKDDEVTRGQGDKVKRRGGANVGDERVESRGALPLPASVCGERAGERGERRVASSCADSQTDAPPRNPRIRGFACKQCHRVRYFSHTKTSAWGEIVCYLSAGLLYGHEVPRPAWLTPKRKNQYAAKPTREPSQRRPQIERLLLTGLSINEVAATLGLSKGTILFYAKQIYPQHGVRCLKELLIKHGLQPRPHMRGPARGKRGEGRARARKAVRSAGEIGAARGRRNGGGGDGDQRDRLTRDAHARAAARP